jgi:hypothetical protein
MKNLIRIFKEGDKHFRKQHKHNKLCIPLIITSFQSQAYRTQKLFHSMTVAIINSPILISIIGRKDTSQFIASWMYAYKLSITEANTLNISILRLAI